MASTPTGRVRTLARQPVPVVAAIVPAWLLIGIAAAAIRVVPFRRLARWLGANVGAMAVAPLASDAQADRAERIGTAIAIAARYAPFRSDCYPQALVAALLCRLSRVPYAVHFGAKLSTDIGTTLGAHAWVVSGPVTLTGGAASAREFTTVGCFAWPPIARSPGSAASADTPR